MFFVVFNGGYEATPLWAVRVPLLVGESIPHQGGRQALSFLLIWGYLPLSLPPFCLAFSTMAQFSEWLHSTWGSLSTSVNRHRHHSLCLCMCSFQGLQPHHLTCGLHPSSVDALADVHGRIHNFPLIQPSKALLVCHWMITLPLFSCDTDYISPLTEVVLHGLGLVHLSHA